MNLLLNIIWLIFGGFIVVIGYILGAAAIIAGGGEAGSAIILGGQDAATKSFLQYSRTQESSADQAAISYLESTGQSGRDTSEEP